MKSRSLPLFIAIVLTAVAILLNVFNRVLLTSDEALLSTLEERMAQEVRAVNKEATDIMMNSGSENLFSALEGKISRSFFLYENEKLRYWSDYTLQPDYYTISSLPSRSLLKIGESLYLVIKYRYEPGFELFGLIELYTREAISNDYLPSGWNTNIFPVKEGINVTPVGEGGKLTVQYLQSKLFDVSFNRSVKVRSEALGFLIVILFFCSFFSLSLYVWNRLTTKVLQGDFEPALFQWAAYLLVLRYLLLLFDFPDRVVETGLFQSLFFASSRINPSLGDMLVNIILFAAVIYFIYRFYNRSKLLRLLLSLRGTQRYIAGLLLLGCIYLLLLYPHLLIQTIYRNSQLSLDISQTIGFDYPRVICYLIFVLSGLSVFMGVHVLFRIFYQIAFREIKIFWTILFSATGLLLLLQFTAKGHFLIVLSVGGILVLVLWFSRVFRQFQQFRYNSFLYIFITVAVVSFMGAYGILEFEQERDRQAKERFADYFLIKNDNLTEYYLNEANARIRSDLFISTRLSSPFLSKEVIEDKIRQVHLGSLFDKYDINIGIYGESDQLVAGDSVGLSVSLNGVPLEEFETEYEGIYFINRVDGEIGKRYIDRIEIKRRDNIIGYVVLDLQLKKIIPNDVYFELLVDNRFTQPWLGKDFSYAIFSQRKVLYNSGEYNYKAYFPVSQLVTGSRLLTEGIKFGGYRHIGLRDLDGRIIVVSAPAYSSLSLATNFSFLLLIQVGLLLSIGLFFAILLIYRRVSINFSTRIQLYFNLAFFVPMMIVSFVTLSSINRMFREEVSREYSVKAENVTENLSSVLDQYLSAQVSRDELLDKLLEVARYTDSDINLYNRFGQLIATSRPIIFDNALLSRNLNPGAFSHVVELKNNEWLADETVGRLNYKTAYYSVRSFKSGDLIGVLGIPFFESEEELENQQIEVLSSILTIFTFVFVAFLLLSYVVSKSLTYPLRLITKKLGKLSLSQKNEPLQWTSEDEIGLMINEYNRMLANLEESKEALGRSQKELAWREIAQQVAHEIKNPLTPMKLTLQHIERRLDDNDTSELKRPISNLLSHIETLSDIATSFSSFARMPIPESKPFELVSVIVNSIDLHKAQEDAEITSNFETNECMVLGDRQLMGRIIANIILNAVQAKHPSRRLKIHVSLKTQKRNAIVSISDNGIGIDESLGSRIFVPNFTTKEKGSGIGLSIAKHGIEHAGGKIWFESEPGQGTIFYIELPRVQDK